MGWDPAELGRPEFLLLGTQIPAAECLALGLVNRFEELQAAAEGTPLAEHLVGELIASEIEVRTGRCETFAEAAAAMVERRRQLLELATRFDVVLGATGTHPWSPWQEQRIIDTPHYRRNDEILRYVVWRNNTFGLHVHVGIPDREEQIQIMNGVRAFLPHLLALSVNSPFWCGRRTGVKSVRSTIFKRFPRTQIPDYYYSWEDYCKYVSLLVRTNCIDDGKKIWWDLRPHAYFKTLEFRICDIPCRAEETVAIAALTQALESQRIIRDRYDAGLASVTDVLRAAEAVLDAEARATAAEMSIIMETVALNRAVGRL